MSRAFIKETDDTPVVLPDRPLSEHPNWVRHEGEDASFDVALLAAAERTVQGVKC